jgi:hypothetical protein
MTMPGFTAEASLFSTKKPYEAANHFASVAESAKVLPQGCRSTPYGILCCVYDPLTGSDCALFGAHYIATSLG